MSRVVVIGAGIAGLAVAARLSTKGHEITVLEQAPIVGGKNAIYSRDGFTFDSGATRLTLPAVYRDLFLKTGASFEDSVDLVPVDDGTKYHWTDGSTVLIPGVGTTKAADAIGSSFGDKANRQWRDLMRWSSEAWKVTRPELFEQALDGSEEPRRLTDQNDQFRELKPWRSLSRLGRKKLSDKHSQMILENYAWALGSDPRQTPAMAATLPYIEHTFGTWHVTGGIGQIAHALYERCIEREVDVRLDTTVDQIKYDDDSVRGVTTTSGQAIDADIVVFSGDQTALIDQLCDSDKLDGLRRRDNTQTSSASTFTIFAAVKGSTPGITQNNVWFGSRPKKAAKNVFAQSLPHEPTISAAVPRDATMHPPDSEAWVISVCVPPQISPRHSRGSTGFGIDWRQPHTAVKYADVIFDSLAERGMELRDRILFYETRTPANVEDLTLSPGGSIWGPASHGWSSTLSRPPNTLPLNGLFQAGGASHPGGGLPGVGMSAEIVAELIGRDRTRPSGKSVN